MHANNFVLMLFFILLTGCGVSGHVTRDGEPMVNVELSMHGQHVSLSTTTNSNGYYRFQNVSAGVYNVSLDLPGSLTIEVIKKTDATGVNNVDFNIHSQTSRDLSTGTVVGSVESNGIFSWRGIPFATPPVDALRWKHAIPNQSWDGEYLALADSEPCYQIAQIFIDIPLSAINEAYGSEDCLYLNVWTPSFDSIPTDEDTRPVMFWIHGGGNTTGESALYDGKMLAEKYGVVVVTVNYRLGIFGWMSHPALRDGLQGSINQSHNYGVTDLILALHWVQDNITQFGGDTDRVMIFGESAGGFNVTALLASPLAEGLFHRAASQSGGFLWSETTTAENYEDEGGGNNSSREVINRLLVDDASASDAASARIIQNAMTHAEMATYLKNKSPEAILSVFDGGGYGMYDFATIIRDDIVIPDQDPADLFASGDYHQVPILLGTNRDEMKLFMSFDPEFTIGGLPAFIRDKEYYALSAQYQSDQWKVEAVDAAARRFTEVQGNKIHGNKVYAYRFDWDEEPTLLLSSVSDLIGAGHFLEIPFVFATPEEFPMAAFDPFLFSPSSKDGRIALANSVSSYWAAFAYYGDPGMGMNDSEAVQWLPWDNGEGTDKMIILDTPEDRGIRMSQEELTLEGLAQKLKDETGFPKHSQKCRTYFKIYGDDVWHQDNCS
ncbi:MAG: carboxylesterase family protein [Pseudomonadales bacterium]|nr:carboxylesterase family protein [Pseudomonadales bacterium]